MRAVFIRSCSLNEAESLEITDDKFHHLKNVVRVKAGQKILVLNGAGRGRVYQVSNFSKGQITLSPTNDLRVASKTMKIDLLIGKLKRDAMDLVIKQACELGVENIFIAETEYSQNYELNLKRTQRLIEAALEQSNNLVEPNLHEFKSLREVKSETYEQVFLFSFDGSIERKAISGSTLILIGPEGGFSDSEEEYMKTWKNLKMVKLDMPILRAVTATPCAVGYVHRMYE